MQSLNNCQAKSIAGQQSAIKQVSGGPVGVVLLVTHLEQTARADRLPGAWTKRRTVGMYPDDDQ